jgi:hypothetical protein
MANAAADKAAIAATPAVMAVREVMAVPATQVAPVLPEAMEVRAETELAGRAVMVVMPAVTAEQETQVARAVTAARVEMSAAARPDTNLAHMGFLRWFPASR